MKKPGAWPGWVLRRAGSWRVRVQAFNASLGARLRALVNIYGRA